MNNEAEGAFTTSNECDFRYIRGPDMVEERCCLSKGHIGEHLIDHKRTAVQTQVGGDHYKNFKIQPVEFIVANDIPFVEGCIIKYACRWKDKDGVDDLRKIQHYCDLLIELTEKENAAKTP